MNPRLLNVTETRHYLGDISDATIRRLVARGELRPVRLPSVKRAGESGRRLLCRLISRADGPGERGRPGDRRGVESGSAQRLGAIAGGEARVTPPFLSVVHGDEGVQLVLTVEAATN